MLCMRTCQICTLGRITCFKATSGKLHPALPPRDRPQICSAAGVASPQQQGRHRLIAPTESHTQRLAQLLAEDAAAGDCICLRGDVGAGKSFFSREFIRAMYGDPCMSVPSPTYLLQNIYDDIEGPPVHHFDLYRLDRALDLQRIGWAQSVKEAICLVEWPDVLGDQLPTEHLDISLSIIEQKGGQQPDGDAAPTAMSPTEDGDEYQDAQPRRISIAHTSGWRDRIDRLMQSLEADPQLIWCRLP